MDFVSSSPLINGRPLQKGLFLLKLLVFYSTGILTKYLFIAKPKNPIRLYGLVLSQLNIGQKF